PSLPICPRAAVSSPCCDMIDLFLLSLRDALLILRVTVYGDAELTNTYRVDDNGAIAFPLVGAVKVRGETTTTAAARLAGSLANRSEEHTSELQSRENLVCRLLLEKKIVDLVDTRV